MIIFEYYCCRGLRGSYFEVAKFHERGAIPKDVGAGERKVREVKRIVE